MSSTWPELPFAPWRDTCAALHLYAQVLGKYRLAHTPWQNHSWHATLYVTARGLTTSAVPDGPGAVDLGLDLLDQAVVGRASDGRSASFPLGPGTVADFHRRTLELVRFLGGTPELDPHPNEIPGAIPFPDDHAARPYDAGAVSRFFQVLVQVDRIFKEFRTAFLGKASPVHLFWGSFDLAVTRFSGRTAPRHPGGVPGLPDPVTREAYSHEVSSAGFWPGGGGVEDAAFYSYAYPAPEGFAQAKVRPAQAFFHPKLGEFLLPYEVVRGTRDPGAALMEFLHSTYEAAAELGRWDRGALECPPGRPRRPRAV
ncbi:MAG TPA: DUF5996 family protein [Myxococcaceae bacterium]|nr:DUF5996 family protein [Myxococcaceae bacterium]